MYEEHNSHLDFEIKLKAANKPLYSFQTNLYRKDIKEYWICIK